MHYISRALSIKNKTDIYSNKKDTSDFHGTVSFDPIKMSQYTKMFIKRPTHKSW